VPDYPSISFSLVTLVAERLMEMVEFLPHDAALRAAHAINAWVLNDECGLDIIVNVRRVEVDEHYDVDLCVGSGFDYYVYARSVMPLERAHGVCRRHRIYPPALLLLRYAPCRVDVYVIVNRGEEK